MPAESFANVTCTSCPVCSRIPDERVARSLLNIESWRVASLNEVFSRLTSAKSVPGGCVGDLEATRRKLHILPTTRNPFVLPEHFVHISQPELAVSDH
jgi:hypothetical protein